MAGVDDLDGDQTLRPRRDLEDDVLHSSVLLQELFIVCRADLGHSTVSREVRRLFNRIFVCLHSLHLKRHQVFFIITFRSFNYSHTAIKVEKCVLFLITDGNFG